MLEGLRKAAEMILVVVGLLSYGCPLQAIVQVFGLDERTVAAWRDRAGQQCQGASKLSLSKVNSP